MKVKKSNIFFWFMGLMGRRLPIYLLAVFVSTLGLAGSKIANAWLVKNIMTAAQTRETEGIILTVIINFIVIVLAMFTWRVGIVRYNIEAKLAIARVEKRVFGKVLKLPVSYYANKHSGDFMSKLVYDMEKAGDIYGSRFRRLADAVLATIIYAVPMLILNWRLSLCLIVLSCVSLTVNGLFTKPMKSMGGKLSAKNNSLTQKLTNILSGMETIKIFPAGHKVLEEYDVVNEECFKVQKKTNYVSAGLESVNSMLDLLSSLAFLGVGVWFLSRNMVNIGELTAIYSIYGGFRRVVLEIGKYIPQMMNCVANAERIYDFLELEEESEHIAVKEETANETIEVNHKDLDDGSILSVRDVVFGYSDDRNVLEGFSLDVKKGEFVAITGHSGCGKSTLVKLLLGFYLPKRGTFTLEGKSYEDMTYRQIRDRIGYVPQEPYLFETTIAENIAFGKYDSIEEANTDDIVEAAKAANAHDFIMKLPEGYNTVLGERGNTLSGGEKQRIAIARAVYKNPPVLLFDEATSALDNESERLVNEAIERLCEDRTTIMIAHRTSTIERADRVVAMG